MSDARAKRSTVQEPNFNTRTLWTADNLLVLKGLNSACIDLVYADPPFNTNRRHKGHPASEAAQAQFEDHWTNQDHDPTSLEELTATEPKVLASIEHAGIVHDDGMRAYLTMLAPRLIEIRRVLKPGGSFVLHCDDTADAYLRSLCDSVFGRQRFRNSIVWKRSSRSNGHRLGRTHDTLLVYGCRTTRWTTTHREHGSGALSTFYREKDERGVYKRVDLTGPGTTSGESGAQWKNQDPTANGRHWAPPRTGEYARWIDNHIDDGYSRITSVHARLDVLDSHGMIHWPAKRGGRAMLKRYAQATTGKQINDVFDDVKRVSNLSTERVGYATQKPVALLNRLIVAATKPGDIVLDPFCGSGTTCVSAEGLKRRWIGIDTCPESATILRDRLDSQFGFFAILDVKTTPPVRNDATDVSTSSEAREASSRS